VYFDKAIPSCARKYKARSEKNQSKIPFFMTSEKENPWSEDESDTGTTTEANEPIEGILTKQYLLVQGNIQFLVQLL
jgi:hypothetical protein